MWKGKLKTFNDFSYVHKMKYNIIQLRGSKDQHKKVKCFMGKINYGLWKARKEREGEEFCLSWNSLLCLQSVSIYGKFSCAVDGTASRALMCLELMNTANLVYQNTTIKPSRAERRSGRRRRRNKIYLEFMLFAMLDFFLHEIPFLFEKTK